LGGAHCIHRKEGKSFRKHIRDLFNNPSRRVDDNIKTNIKEIDRGEDSYGLGYESLANTAMKLGF
jgi:hypothetical protein